MGQPFFYKTDESEKNYHILGKEVLFTEDGSTTITGSVVLPPGSHLLDIRIQSTALWNDGTSASMVVGDAADPDGFYTAVDLKATDLLVDETIRFESTGGTEGAYIVAATGELNDYDAAARTITGVVTTGGQDGTTGRTRMLVVYARPEATNATGV